MVYFRGGVKMKELKLYIKLESDTLVGTGESYGAIIDGDVVFDSYGFPYIPAKRIKGCMRDSLEEIMYLFQKAKLNIQEHLDMESCFGQRNESGDEFRGNPGKVRFENLMPISYEETVSWIESISDKEYSSLFTKEKILSQYTRIRRQTRIDPKTGTASKNSLRTMRVLKKGLEFMGNISLTNHDKKVQYTLALSISNFSNMGTSRNRGLGLIKAELRENGEDVTLKYIQELKSQCK